MNTHRNRQPARHRRRAEGLHWGSFAAGTVLGVVLALTGALLPPLLESGSTTAPAPEPGPAKSVAAPKFEFFESLPRNHVTAASATDDTPPPGRPKEPVEYVLQAGSFTNQNDAERLRTMVAALGLPAVTVVAQLGDGAQRHRVIVGPFAADADMRRAISQLREKNIDPLPLARKPGTG